MSVVDAEPAELPAVTHEAVRSRIIVEALIASLPPKQAGRFILEMTEMMADLDTADIRRIRSAVHDVDVRKHRLGARALWTARLPRFVTLLRKSKYRKLLRR